MSLVIENLRKFISSPCAVAKSHGDKETICICETITPVLRYCQFFGVFPASLHSPFDEEDDDDGESKSRCDLKVKLFNKCAPLDAINMPDFLQKSKCYIKSRWLSYPSFINIVLLVAFITVTTWVLLNIQNVLKVYFLGTDFYTFGAQTICLYSQNIIILGSSFIHRNTFGEIWSLLLKTLRNLEKNPIHHHHKVANNFGVQNLVIETILQSSVEQIRHQNLIAATAAPEVGEDKESREEPIELKNCSKIWHRLKLLRIFSFVTVSTALILSIVHTTLVTSLLFNGCFDEAQELDPTVGDYASGKPPCPFDNFFLLLQKLFYSVIDFVHQGIAILFGVMCLVVYVFFREIVDQMETTLKTGTDVKIKIKSTETVPSQPHLKLEHLRICYEDLSQCCRLMSQCFGLGILAVLITSVISITCSLYSYTLYSGAIKNDETVNVAKFYVIWAFHGWFGVFCLVLILVPGQLVTNVSDAPSQVIGRSSLTHVDKETKYQLSQFQHQSRQPVVLTACNVTNVGVSFIAAAATNVTTYILVILQFRLGVESRHANQTGVLSNT